MGQERPAVVIPWTPEEEEYFREREERTVTNRRVRTSIIRRNDAVARAFYASIRKSAGGLPKWEDAAFHIHSAFHKAAAQAINTYESMTQKEETDMSREVVETFEYGKEPHYEVEELVHRNRASGWEPLLNRVSNTEHFETYADAKRVANEHSKLYHRNTRVVKVTP